MIHRDMTPFFSTTITNLLFQGRFEQNAKVMDTSSEAARIKAMFDFLIKDGYRLGKKFEMKTLIDQVVQFAFTWELDANVPALAILLMKKIWFIREIGTCP